MKKCKRCQKEKNLEEFGLCSKNKDKLHSRCKKCNVEYNKIYDSPNARKRWMENNVDLNKKIHKEYYLKNKESCLLQSRKWGEDNFLKSKYNIYKNGALRRNIDWNLTKEEFESYENIPCYYCNEIVRIGLDRLDNEKGYVISNCVSCCGVCNRMKMNLDVNVFLNKIKQIYKNGKI